MVNCTITEFRNSSVYKKTIISKEDIKNKIYKELVEPTKTHDREYIGIEIELPIINLNKEAVSFEVVHNVYNEFKEEFNYFKVEGIDHEGHIHSLKDEKTDDVICFDCSYNNLEFAMGKEEELFSINERFSKYYSFFKERFEKYNHTLTGMGINPYHKFNKEVPIANERYLMLYHHLKSYTKYDDLDMEFHHYPGFGMFSSASQVQLDVPYDELVDTINVFSKLEPIKAVLFSNSVFLGENEDLLCYRDIFWQNSTHGINPHNIGMYDVEFNSINDISNYLASFSIYSVIRNGYYINFPPMYLDDYFSRDEISGEYHDGEEYKTIKFKPSLDDIRYVRAFKFINLTFRGTIEYRSVCTQPIKDSMSVAAFHVGLKHKTRELSELFENASIFNQGYNATELRKLLIKANLPSFVNEDELYDLVFKVLDLAKEGLKKRDNGEEVFLEALYERAKNRTNPAKDVLKLLKNGESLEKIIKDYSTLD